jgi:ABC-type Zn uptake system ZnuABC Zn-binding protein ZnuA
MPLDLIFTKSRLLLSKTSKDWRQWQDEYADYMASLSLETHEELLEYLQMDYKLTDAAIEELSSEISLNSSDLMELKLPGIDK